MENPSLKKTVLRNFGTLVAAKELETNNIILITAAGTIVGKVATALSDETKFTTDNMLQKFSQKFVETYRQEYEIKGDEPLPGNDGFVFLNDVRIISGNHTTNLPSLIVFFDQIIAVTIGNIN